MLPTATLKKKNSIKKRGDERTARKMQTLMSSRPCGTLLNILNILGKKKENSFSQLKPEKGVSLSLKILWGNSLNYLLAFWLYFTVRWVAGEEERKKRAGQEVSGRKLLLTFSISVWNILKAACLFEIAQSLATMGRCLPDFFRSYLHTKDQQLSCYYAAKPQRAWERRGYRQV